MLAKRCDVHIQQGPLYKQAKCVWEHEIPILEGHFGEGNITKYEKHRTYNEKKGFQVITDDIITYPVEELDYDMEYGRLEEMYGRHPEIPESLCENIYGRLAIRAIETTNEKLYREEFENQQKGLPDDLEKEDDIDKPELKRLGVQELRNILKEMGVKFFGGAPREHLISLINREQRLQAGGVQ